MANYELKGKTALITGACGGLGRVIAESFLNAHANVVVCDINDALIADFKFQVADKHAERTLVVKADITDDAAIEEVFKQGEEKFGAIDILINSAGRIDGFAPVGDMDRKVWDSVIALNLTAPAMISKRAIAKWLEKGEKGAIVNIASIAGVRGFTCGAAYTASKHGLLGLTKNTGAFYGSKGIRCNAIMAGAMQTNIGNSLAQEMNMEGYMHMRQNFPEQGGMELCDTTQVASLVLYLCSDEAAIVNGAVWTADSGVTAN